MPESINMSFALLLVYCIISPIIAENTECDNSDAPFLCHSTRVVRSVLDHVLGDSDTALNLVPGIDIVEVAKSDTNDTNAESETNRTMDNSYLGRVSRYLQRHELKIKFPEIVKSVGDNDTLNGAVKSVGDGQDITGKSK